VFKNTVGLFALSEHLNRFAIVTSSVRAGTFILSTTCWRWALIPSVFAPVAGTAFLYAHSN
jgi:hypothetical protein